MVSSVTAAITRQSPGGKSRIWQLAPAIFIDGVHYRGEANIVAFHQRWPALTAQTDMSVELPSPT